MYALFDDAGKFLAGKILSEAESSAQIELDSGKRLKVKAVNILLKFDKPSPAEFMAQAQSQAQRIELELAWEFAPEDDFGFADLARDYFSANATVAEQAGALLRLHEAPHYFRRAGKGRFKKAPAEVIAQALAAIEKKKQVVQQIADWAAVLAQGECPVPIREQLYKILFKPDKNAPEYKAVVEAARSTQTAPLDLLRQAGAIESAYEFHWKRFLFDHFPKGTGFPVLNAPDITTELPLAAVQAYSIDDSQTTEIDDALSLQGLGSGRVILGVHIAAPGLALTPDSAVDAVARHRLSTVYMPGHKITMLPDEVVQRYTLAEGRACPAVSLYLTFDEATLDIQHTETKLERVPIAANLRHDQLDSLVTPDWLEAVNTDPANARVGGPHGIDHARLAFLWRLAQDLKKRREGVRGKPETFNRPDYNFRLQKPEGGDDRPHAEPQGNETVLIGVRQRGAPLDLIVAEAMILANSHWGVWLSELGLPGIYRSQASLAPGIKVRMGTKALPHAGIGVPAYAWSTSPLRRYTDLVNQWQIIAAVQHGATAALVAPFKPKSAELFSIISAFEAAYSAYNGYQAGMERFWTLQYLQQNGLSELVVTVFKDGTHGGTHGGTNSGGNGGVLARADHLPLVLPVFGQGNGQAPLTRGDKVRVKLSAIDLIGLEVSGQVIERLDDLNSKLAAETAEGFEFELEDDEAAAGPIAIAVDVTEVSAEAPLETPIA